ncbi:MAG: ABC transporter permease [Chloroflexota bacterium]|nr:ABC transporter permease [Chloroflexota bacterium]MCY3582538.1 ABC transporter permease [Chloroflexota bacterium]MDE2650187.1 ABC transporter permease [Chloroflexota bacterium]MXV92217.1 ABC transporter permease [Chloroflexota bacterium]MXX51162.1 ABC transporter permease [Chloroflexota bacterium]
MFLFKRNSSKKKKAAAEQLVSLSLTQKALRSIWRDKLTLLALAYLVGITIIALLAPFITNNIMQVDPNEPITANKFTPPLTDGYILGADDIGRDQLARLLHASGVSMGIGFFGTLLALCIGVVLGMIAGFRGGYIDDALNWFVTTLDSVPFLFLLIIMASFISFNSTTLILVFGLFGWFGIYRLIRGQAISLRHREYITAASALGAGTGRIIFSHILPNLVSITAIVLMRGIAGLILAESGLSFLGYGVQPPQATWGNMLTKSLQFMRLGEHLIIFPLFMISLTVLCFYIVGDGIRDAFDPTLQR